MTSRVERGLTNRVPDTTSRSLWQIFRANVFTLFNAIVGTSFLLLLLLGQWQDALFGLAAAGNAVIGVVEEYRAKKSLDRLAVLSAPHARVLREGEIHDIATADVVRDDVMVLRAGDQVTADAAVLESSGLEVDESLLTGESDPVDKDPGSEVLSGSIVVAGHGRARVVRVGAASFASRLTADARRFSLVNSEIRNSLNRVLRWIAWVLLPVVILVVNGEVQSRGGWQTAFSTGAWSSALVGVIASVIAMVPLGLVLLDERGLRRRRSPAGQPQRADPGTRGCRGSGTRRRPVHGQDGNPHRGRAGLRCGPPVDARAGLGAGPRVVWRGARGERHGTVPEHRF